MLASAATALVAGALLAAPSKALAQQQDPLRIISFNTWGKSTVSPESLALFGNGDYDIITIQEYRTSYGEDLRDKLGVGGFGTYWLQDSGDKGIASRLPGTAGVGDRGNPYVIIEASGSRPATIVSTEHLNYWDDPFDQRIGQAKQLNGWAKGQTAPIIITGDFNAGDVSERGLLEVSQQELLLQKARETQNADYKAWALQYVARNHAIGSAQYNAAAAYINQTSSTKPTGLFSSETYPVEGNTPYTLNVLKKDYQLLQNPEDREPFMPHGEADGSTTWPSVKEDDEAFKWPSWGRTQIDHFFASRPYAKWWQPTDAQGDPYTGGVLDQSVSTTPGGVALSDHEPIAHDILWYGPQVETRADGSVALTFNDQALGLKPDQEFQLSRNNNRTDVYLGQISDNDGRPIFRRPVEVSDDYLAKLVAEAVYDRYSTDQLNALQAQLKAFVPADQYEAYQAELTRLAAKTGNDGYFRSVIKTYFDGHRSEFPGISNIGQMSWEQWGRILINDVRANVEFQTLPIVPEWDDLREALNLDDPAARALLSQKTGLDFENDPDAPLKLRLDCKNLTLLGLQGARDLCVDNHERFKDLLVKDGLTISIDESAALGSSDGTLTLNNGGLRTAGADDPWAAWASPVAAIDKKIALQGQGGWIDISNPDVPVAALQQISGDGLLEKRGEGTLELAAVNGYTGGTVVQAGVLRSTTAGGFVDGTGYTVNGGTLDLNGFNLTMSSLSGAGGKVALGAAQLTVNQTGDTHFDGGIGGAGGLTKAGSGKLVLNGLANYGGDTTINGGVLQFGDGSAGSASELAGKMTVAVGGLSIQTPATLKLAKDARFADNTSLSIRATADSPSLQANALALGQGVAFNLSGVTSVSEEGKVLIDTAAGIDGDFGAVTVGGYSGPTDYMTVHTKKSDDGKQYLASYGLSWTANNNLAHGTFTLTNATDTFEVGANLSDQAANEATGWDGKSLTKKGAGTLILSGANSYSGGTAVQAGTLGVGSAAALGTGGVTTYDATTVRFYAESLGLANKITLVDGVTAFDTQDHRATLSGAIDGAGGLAKSGGGALLLTGSNSYSGGTILEEGGLGVGSSSALGTGGLATRGETLLGFVAEGVNIGNAITLVDGVTTVVTGGYSATLSGTVNGAGGLAMASDGFLRLDGDNSYSGGTELYLGGLGIGSSTALGTGRLTTHIGTRLDFLADGLDLRNAVTAVGQATFNTLGHQAILSGAINGTGGVAKLGAGTLILSGTNSYTGGTTVQAGTLIGDAGSIIGNASIRADAKLVFNQTMNADYRGVLSGSGALGKDGGAALRLTGDSSGFAGTTTISNGTLLVGNAEGQGKLGGSALVANGGVLGGGGVIGSGAGSTVTVASGGTIAPGNSIGTLTVAGDLAFKTGSTYSVEANAGGQTDKIAATGAVTIEGGTVNVLAGGGTYAQNTLYTILTDAGGRSGAFASVTSNLAFLAASLNYDANSVFLKLQRNGLDFASVAGTPNQGATGDGVESLGTGNAVYDAVVQLDAAGARSAFDQLSGEVHAGAKTALVEDSDVVRDAMAARLRASFDTAGSSALPVMAYGEATHGMATAVGADYAGAAFWSQGFGSWGSSDGSGGSANLDRRSGGLLAGVDSTAGDWRIGLLAGYSQTSFDADDRSSSGSSDNYHLGVYGGRQFGNLGLRSGASYSWHRVETSRSVAFPGFGDSLTADYNAGTFQAFGELGYGFETQAARFEPFANLAYVNLDSDGFDEDGGAAALSSDGGSTDTTFTTLGLRASAGFNLGSVDATARAMLGWRHAFGDTTPESVQAFSGGDAFSIAGAPIAENAAVIEAGVDFNFSPTATLGVSYSGQLASDAQDHGFKADLKIRF